VLEKINILEKFSAIHSHWDPKIVSELNDQQVKLVKFEGEFDWHKHDNEDELFMVIKGKFDMQFRDKSIRINENELIVVPRGIEHCPIAEEEVYVLLFEPSSTLNTGNVKSDKTKTDLEKI
jgi:mannose-6-phosphate isomerase-like protein (cupin superfamily)